MATSLTQGDIKNIYGVSRARLLEAEKRGEITPTRTKGGHRRYDKDEVSSLFGTDKESNKIGGSPYIEMGASGNGKWMMESVYGETLSEFKGIKGRKLLREMRVNDPVISAVFFTMVNSLKQVSWRVSTASESEADKECADFVTSCMNDMSWSWGDQMDLIINPMLEQGFAIPEIVYKRRNGNFVKDGRPKSNYNDGRIGWRKFAPRPVFSLVNGDEFLYDDTGGVQGIHQNIEGKDPVKIPIEKLLHFRTTMYPANSPWGQAIHRSMYVPYWYSQNMQEIEGIGVERDLAGIPIVYLGEDCTLTGTDSDYEKAVELVSNIRRDEQAGIVVPKPKMGLGESGRGMLIELLSTQGRRQWDVDRIIERYDKRKALVVLAQFIMLGMEKVGSFALAVNQTDLFELAAGAFLSSMADVLNRHAIPRLINMNVFPNITGYPKLEPSTFGIPNLHSIAQFVNTLVDKEVLTPDDELERHLRHIAKLPQKNIDNTTSTMSTAEAVQTGADLDDVVEDSTGNKGTQDETIEKLMKSDDFVSETEADIATLHGKLGDMVLTLGATAALARYRDLMSGTLMSSYQSIWKKTRGMGYESGEYDDFVNQYHDEQMEYLDGFISELGERLSGVNAIGEINNIIQSTMNRATMYAGGAWAVYNQALIYDASPESMWRWEGALDEKSCSTCLEEVNAGVRMLKDMTVFPAMDTECGVNCRHTLVRV